MDIDFLDTGDDALASGRFRGPTLGPLRAGRGSRLRAALAAGFPAGFYYLSSVTKPAQP